MLPVPPKNSVGWHCYPTEFFDAMISNPFDEIVANYEKSRWEYPRDLFAGILQYCKPKTGNNALEIGAGTGKATVPFLDAGYAVTAVEIGKNMAEFLRDKFKENANFNVINATFEDAPLDEGVYDLVYAASAFHWVDAEIGCPKAFNILKSGGIFALFRNNTPPADGDELYEEIQTVYEKHYYTHYKSQKRPVKKSMEDLLTPSELYRNFRFEGMEKYGFADITMDLYDAVQTYTASEYIALLDTYSDHMSLPDENKKALYSGIGEAICRHGNSYKIDAVFQLYLGRKP